MLQCNNKVVSSLDLNATSSVLIKIRFKMRNDENEEVVALNACGLVVVFFSCCLSMHCRLEVAVSFNYKLSASVGVQ